MSLFFHKPGLTTFDDIIGFDQLSQVAATLDLKNNLIRFNGGIEPLRFLRYALVNFTKFDDTNVPLKVRASLMMNLSTLKLTPFPWVQQTLSNQEFEDLLSNDIIRHSSSPYNNPVWVVGKKGSSLSDSLSSKRLVIDFRKLNSMTIADRYPMPSISRKGNYFTTLDLKSGYHQIILTEKISLVNAGKYSAVYTSAYYWLATSILMMTLQQYSSKNISVVFHEVLNAFDKLRGRVPPVPRHFETIWPYHRCLVSR